MSADFDKNEIIPATLSGAEDVSDIDKEDEKKEIKGEGDEYYGLPLGNRSIIFSVASLIAGLLSLLFCPFAYPSFFLAPLAIASSVVYRLQFGFFNKPAVIGLILSIFGGIFSIVALVIAKLNLFA